MIILNFNYETNYYPLSAPITWSVHREGEDRDRLLKKNETAEKDGTRDICLTL
jgi:hypothetical protein